VIKGPLRRPWCGLMVTTRAIRALEHARVRNLEDLVEVPISELARLRQVGRLTLRELTSLQSIARVATVAIVDPPPPREPE
jgi:hypothetical protein